MLNSYGLNLYEFHGWRGEWIDDWKRGGTALHFSWFVLASSDMCHRLRVEKQFSCQIYGEETSCTIFSLRLEKIVVYGVWYLIHPAD